MEPLQTLNPYELQQAETINQSQGVKCEGDYNGCYVSDISSGDYIKVRNVDFGEAGAQAFSARLRVEKQGTLQIRIGSKSSTIRGRITAEPTNGEWQDFTCELTSPITGVHDLFFRFAGDTSTQMDFDNWQFYTQPTTIRSAEGRLQGKKASYDLSGRQINTTNKKQTIQIVDGKIIINT